MTSPSLPPSKLARAGDAAEVGAPGGGWRFEPIKWVGSGATSDVWRARDVATGSEVALAVEAYEQLAADGVRARVVSLPSFHLFDRQPEDYRESVLPASVPARVSIEEASTLGWDRYVGPRGEAIGMHTFGSSAPLKDVLGRFGFTPEQVVQTARELLSRNGGGGSR